MNMPPNFLPGDSIADALTAGVHAPTPVPTLALASMTTSDVVQIVRAVTTYTKDAQSIPDISLLDLTTIRTLDYARKAWVERISLRFPRSKKSARVKAQVREELLDVAYKLQELEILEAVAENEDGFIVEDDLQDPNRLDCRIPADVVNGLHIVAMRIDLLL